MCIAACSLRNGIHRDNFYDMKVLSGCFLAFLQLSYKSHYFWFWVRFISIEHQLPLHLVALSYRCWLNRPRCELFARIKDSIVSRIRIIHNSAGISNVTQTTRRQHFQFTEDKTALTHCFALTEL